MLGSDYRGIEIFILSNRYESWGEPIIMLNLLLQDPNLSSPSKPIDFYA
jgi:hypothetical protein